MWLLATGVAVKSPVAVKITSGAERFGANRPHWNTGARNRSFSGGIDSDSDFGSAELISILIPGEVINRA